MPLAENIEIQLVKAVRKLGSKGLTPATGGNFSCRVTPDTILITSSGVNKEELNLEDLLLCNRQGIPKDKKLKPSAETRIHTAIYEIFPEVKAVLHTHSLVATVLSRFYSNQEYLEISGYEMLKSITGFKSHLESLHLPIFNNSQDMEDIAQEIKANQLSLKLCPGFVLRAHGLYAWGQSLDQALRHIEGLEFLLNCEHQTLLLERVKR